MDTDRSMTEALHAILLDTSSRHQGATMLLPQGDTMPLHMDSLPMGTLVVLPQATPPLFNSITACFAKAVAVAGLTHCIMA